MDDKKPGEITAIASYIANRIPTEWIDPTEATEAWRSALKYARKTGVIEPITDLLSRAEPEDATLQAHCDTLKR